MDYYDPSSRPTSNLPVTYDSRPGLFLKCLVSSTLVLVVWYGVKIVDLFLTVNQVGHSSEFMAFLWRNTEFWIGVPLCGFVLYFSRIRQGDY